MKELHIENVQNFRLTGLSYMQKVFAGEWKVTAWIQHFIKIVDTCLNLQKWMKLVIPITCNITVILKQYYHRSEKTVKDFNLIENVKIPLLGIEL